jgi:hypothetical protein
MDAEQLYLDSVYLEFHCFCLGSFAISNTATMRLFPDVFHEDVPQFGTFPRATVCWMSESGQSGTYFSEWNCPKVPEANPGNESLIA